jgi:hypothetical protein
MYNDHNNQLKVSRVDTKTVFSFSRKAKIMRKWGNGENFCQKIVKKSGQNMIMPKSKIFA